MKDFSLLRRLVAGFLGLLPVGWTASVVADGVARTEGAPDYVEVMRLWPEGQVPGEAVYEGDLPEMSRRNGRLQFVHVPTLEVWRPQGEVKTGAAVVVCPGGGYRILADGHEGKDIAVWLNEHGITAVVLRYRMFPYRHPVPMMDVQRAMRTVRANAGAWGVDPGKIGVLGFSAGGHLASTAAVHHADADADSEDPVERVSSRPDFAVLVYPVISMREGVTHGGSRKNLLGPEPGEDLVGLMSNDERVDEATPATFLVHSKDDKAVKLANSERFLAGLREHGVAGELMVFETGGHGYGLGRGAEHETAAWPGRCIAWLAEQGVIGGEREVQNEGE